MHQLSDRTLGQWLEHWAETTPDKEYIVYSDRNLRFTWKQFNQRVDDLAKGLLAIGVEKGSHVGIWATNVPDWLTFLYASAKIGAVLVTVNTNYKQNELEYLCENSDMHTLCIIDGTWECESDDAQTKVSCFTQITAAEYDRYWRAAALYEERRERIIPEAIVSTVGEDYVK
jgi:fatty-acyl-CoA synthase